ncbi:MAG TPA: hypothetical protein VF148_14730 [Acidimicrobiia bacterium]
MPVVRTVGPGECQQGRGHSFPNEIESPISHAGPPAGRREVSNRSIAV